MKKVLIIGSVVPQGFLADRARAEAMVLQSFHTGWSPAEFLKPRTDDPFQGGSRSKGEKKRAARERRMRGGY